jgi:hypothetical protein
VIIAPFKVIRPPLIRVGEASETSSGPTIVVRSNTTSISAHPTRNSSGKVDIAAKIDPHTNRTSTNIIEAFFPRMSVVDELAIASMIVAFIEKCTTNI